MNGRTYSLAPPLTVGFISLFQLGRKASPAPVNSTTQAPSQLEAIRSPKDRRRKMKCALSLSPQIPLPNRALHYRCGEGQETSGRRQAYDF